jgi:catechol 2,3-dioxygenase-like lactoylglutathione lyase family enzyme
MSVRLLLLVLLCASPALAQDSAPRPHVAGVSHIALYVHDIAQSRAFYKDFLGFAEPFSLTNDAGALRLTWIKINDHQSIELFPEKESGSDRLYHIALETDDAEAMRLFLKSKGIAVPDKTPVGKIGNFNYFVQDPDGHNVELVQYAANGWTLREKGKFVPDTRISTRMAHVGVLVGDLDAALKFYAGVLGGTETWRGSKDSKTLSWVNVKVPDGNDYIEFMLYPKLPAPDQRGKFHHLSLEVPDIAKAKATLAARAATINYTRPLEVQTGVNRKRQLNLWDPDATRIELMEPQTIDGVPSPSSPAPPPHQNTLGRTHHSDHTSYEEQKNHRASAPIEHGRSQR